MLACLSMEHIFSLPPISVMRGPYLGVIRADIHQPSSSKTKGYGANPLINEQHPPEGQVALR
jgi:hypothetical protein